MMTGLGSTETAPAALFTGIEGAESGLVGLPIPGAELKLNDPAGNSRVEIGGSYGIVIRDSKGREIWRSPQGFGVVPATE